MKKRYWLTILILTICGASTFYLLNEEKPLTESEKILQQASGGSSAAQFNLGVMYDKGDGVTQDYKEAFKWYELAAKQGFAEAQYNLGLMYEKGQGAIENYLLAHAYLNLAASSGDKDAATYRDTLSTKMTSEQLAEAQKLAKELSENIKANSK